jgi:hypothetical protein
MNLIKTISQLITEQAAYGDVIDAIKKRKVLVIYYDGDEPGGRGLREIEPVCLGTSKANNKILRAWDREGSSHTDYLGEQPLPGWRLFRLDKILTIKPTGEIYNEPRPNYNFTGDKTMANIIINAKFDDVVLDIDTLIKTQLTNIVTEILTGLIDDIVRRQGVEALTPADFTKAAELFNRIYKKIGGILKRQLTNVDKQKLRPEIIKLVSGLQPKLKEKYLKK